MKILNETTNDIYVGELKDGQIGIITEWGRHTQYIGRIIQRYKDSLVVLGEQSENGWYSIPIDNDYRVRILPKGTKLEI